MASSAVTRPEDLELAFITAATFITTHTFTPATIPPFVAPLPLSPAGKVRAVDGAAFDIFEHAVFFVMIRRAPRSTLVPYTTRFRSESRVAHAEGNVLTGEFLKPRGNIDEMVGGAVASSQDLELAFVSVCRPGCGQSDDRQKQQDNETKSLQNAWIVHKRLS